MAEIRWFRIAIATVRLSRANDFTVIPFGDRRCPKSPD
jgi:hypothetical protein